MRCGGRFSKSSHVLKDSLNNFRHQFVLFLKKIHIFKGNVLHQPETTIALPQPFSLFFRSKFIHQDLNQAAPMEGLPCKKLFHDAKLLSSTSFKCIYFNSEICLA